MKTETKTIQGSSRREPNRPTETTGTFQSRLPVTLKREDIAHLAYALWEKRGCPHGSPEVDWREAERQLRQPSEHVSR